MGIGGNDIGFAQVIVDFMLNPFGNFNTNDDAKEGFQTRVMGSTPLMT